jgi:hypothetical protein
MKINSSLPVITSYAAAVVLIGVFIYNYYTNLNNINMPSSPNQQQSHDTNYTAIKAPIAFIYTDAVETPKSKTQVTIPLRFTSTPKELWLVIEQETGNYPAKILISHPVLNQINWTKISDGYHYLWQKKPTYQTIAEFTNRLPPNSQLLIDSSLQGFYQKTISGTLLTETTDINDYDYIFTTFPGVTGSQNQIISTSTLDASFATKDPQNKYTWRIESKDASPDNPYYLGPINIGYQ